MGAALERPARRRWGLWLARGTPRCARRLRAFEAKGAGAGGRCGVVWGIAVQHIVHGGSSAAAAMRRTPVGRSRRALWGSRVSVGSGCERKTQSSAAAALSCVQDLRMLETAPADSSRGRELVVGSSSNDTVKVRRKKVWEATGSAFTV